MSPRSLEAVAGRIQRRMGIDPMTIAIIVQAILAALELIQECRKTRRWPSVRKLGRENRGRRRLEARIMRQIGPANWERLHGAEFISELLLEGDNHSAAEIDDLALQAL